MSKELSPKYNPAEVEAGRYQKWLDADVFKPSGDKKAKPYSIVIPPPNVTGKLHLGHAWDTTLQDIIIRQKRFFAAFRGAQNKADARAAPAVEWCDAHGTRALDRRASGREAAQWCAKCPALSSEPPSNGCPT